MNQTGGILKQDSKKVFKRIDSSRTFPHNGLNAEPLVCGYILVILTICHVDPFT